MLHCMLNSGVPLKNNLHTQLMELQRNSHQIYVNCSEKKYSNHYLEQRYESLQMLTRT